MTGIRDGGRELLRRLALLGWLRRMRSGSRAVGSYLTDSRVRDTRRAEREQFADFARRYGASFSGAPGSFARERTALIVARHFPAIEMNICLVKALELAGYRVSVLVQSERGGLERYFRLAGVSRILRWAEVAADFDFSGRAAAVVASCRSVEELRQVEHRGVRVGRSTVSTVLRSLRVGTLDLTSEPVRRSLAQQLAAAMGAVDAMTRILDRERPTLMLTTDVEYVPGAEQFECCLARGISVIKYARPHCPNALMFKRYGQANMDQDPSSLSDESWALMRSMPWTRERRDELESELAEGYAEGNWYGSGVGMGGTGHDSSALRQRLGLDSSRKTTFVFPHVAWDASLRWGKDLFNGYEEWLVETVRAALANRDVNWVVKIHPAHARKNQQERQSGEPAEVLAVRRALGALPSHIKLLSPDTDISTYSLFPLMDYCVTVRGTVGMEAALRGIPVLTAGTGRYDGRGFTLDSDSPEQYLSRLARIQENPPISGAERELAERFAYAIFLLRPFRLETARLEFHPDHPRSSRHAIPRLTVRNPQDWKAAPDLSALARWISDDSNPDFLLSVPGLADG